MKRVLVVAAALVLVVGAIRTAYAYGVMVATAEYNSAPSGVAFFVMVPYLAVSVVLLAAAAFVPRRRPTDESADTRSLR